MRTQPDQRSYDAVVVGAGLIGLACAWRIAARGLSVCVLDRSEPGGGASGVAAGMLAPVTEVEFGGEAVLELNLASAAAYPDFVAELEELTGLPTGYGRCGSLHLALDRDEAEELGRLHGFQRSLGLESEWLGPRECRELEPGLGTRLAGGIYVPAEAQIDPRKLILALAEAVRASGGSIESGVEVVSPFRSGGRVAGVDAADGSRYQARTVVVAAGCWSSRGSWLGAEEIPVRPVKGQILRLREVGDGPLCRHLIRTPWVYVLARPGGEVVIGATVEERGFDEAVTAGGIHELLREAYRVLPDVSELELVELAAGLRPGTPDNAPLIGPAGEGLLLATGHFRNGVLLAPVSAEAVAAMVAGEEPLELMRRFAPSRFEAVGAR